MKIQAVRAMYLTTNSSATALLKGGVGAVMMGLHGDMVVQVPLNKQGLALVDQFALAYRQADRQYVGGAMFEHSLSMHERRILDSLTLSQAQAIWGRLPEMACAVGYYVRRCQGCLLCMQRVETTFVVVGYVPIR